MHNEQDQPSVPKDASPTLRPSSSFVYPVKSLLSGIQPAENQLPSPFLPKLTRQSSDNVASLFSAKRDSSPCSISELRRWPNHANIPPSSPRTQTTIPYNLALEGHVEPRSKRSFSVCQLHDLDFPIVPPLDQPSNVSLFPRRHRSTCSRTRRLSPNFRSFPGGESSLFPSRSFTRYPSGAITPPLSPSLATIERITPGSVIEPTTSSTTSTSEFCGSVSRAEPTTIPPRPLQKAPEKHTFRSTDVDERASRAEEDSNTSILSGAYSSTSQPDSGGFIPSLNPAECGIVHLSPIPSPRVSEKGSVRVAGTPIIAESSLSRTISGDPEEPPCLSKLDAELLHPSLLPNAGTSVRSTRSISDDEPFVTFRFRYAQDNNGYHVVIGREGQLQRCEDEASVKLPATADRAVQGFGVLIAIEETEEALVVRQVSENSTELLGLPPSYLFSLNCFTDTLPDSQAGLLWDNIQFLGEPATNADEEEDCPHVFLLTGWGAPGTVLPGERDLGNESRRTWTCYCAIHRSAMSNKVTLGHRSGLVIMEFELERDSFNPLYPPPPSGNVQQPSGCESPNSIASNAELCSSAGSEHTLVTEDKSSFSDMSYRTSFSSSISQSESRTVRGLRQMQWTPSTEDILASTTSHSKPLPALERLRRMMRTDSSDPKSPSPVRWGGSRHRRRRMRDPGSVGMMDVFAVMAQINEQLGSAPDLDTFLKVVVGIIKDLTQFHRVLVYQFDEAWNGQVVAELVDWNQTHELYRGLHFPASDIPAQELQARELYALNKVRLLYDRTRPTARIIVRCKEDLDTPLNMTHCYLRAMSPIHIKYLDNMGVRASMSVSILAFGHLWGLVACHSYGDHGMRVSFPVRQMLRLLSQSVSRNVERLSYAQRLHTRKLINTIASERHPTGYIVSNADDLLGLFDADFGILVIGEGAKILGPNQNGQEILIMAEYLRLKQFTTIQTSQAVTVDFPDLQLSTGLEVIAGLLYVPLSSGGKDFIAFLRKGQIRDVHWAGRPYQDEGSEKSSVLEPRKSFKIWSETVAGRCRAWTDEQFETAAVLALVYGKFIEVWRQKESAVKATKLTNLLLSNASHEGVPCCGEGLYLELALNGPLDRETRANLSQSHAASKSLLFSINDLLDLTRLESGNETSCNEAFDLHCAIEEATLLYRKEAERRNIGFQLEFQESPRIVVGDVKKIRTIVQNLTANAFKYTVKGSITVRCSRYDEPEGLRGQGSMVVEIIVADTGCGISTSKLESIFREFEQVESSESKTNRDIGVGLGLAVVARNVEQLGGQLRVESNVGEGSCFSLLLPVTLPSVCENVIEEASSLLATPEMASAHARPRVDSTRSRTSEIDDFVEALSSDHMTNSLLGGIQRIHSEQKTNLFAFQAEEGTFQVTDSQVPLRPIKLDPTQTQVPGARQTSSAPSPCSVPVPSHANPSTLPPETAPKLRVLIVEDNKINRAILAKRLSLNGHTVVNTTNGQEGLERVEADQAFDVILMDIQMPLLNGFETTQRIRDFEKNQLFAQMPQPPQLQRPSHALNGRIPIFAVSASLVEKQREELIEHGMDGWIVKPIDFTRLKFLLLGVTNPLQRQKDMYRPGYNWEQGGWLV
ncbi:hypothetical protein AMATHDRAFT_45648 [Amanita thiersii Skay4041]|uniref:Phytochrome n=1 Tax=Amanita thiersii Skay4041 TaxID=703135 RepID=A0A2A9NZK7_9AGAR|nr:hypothetical protein AMATHDRAFT_45648 [Amanita thiersii Skay4041]